MTIMSGSGTFTVTFTTPVAPTSSVARVTIQSSSHATGALGVSWTSRASAADSDWNSVTYGEGLFVAVAKGGPGSGVMSSPDGINWTARSAATANSWMAVTYGDGKFVAVSNSGTGNRVMTSVP